MPIPNLVLSLFPGLDLLGRGFELEGFHVVRGPDLLWGQDVREFSPPCHVFEGIIAGPPCQDFSRARRDPPTGNGLAMIEEFRRCVLTALPTWWLMENVPGVPDVGIRGYQVQRFNLMASEFGCRQRRLRRFQFGYCDGAALIVARSDTRPGQLAPAAMASEGDRRERRDFAEFCRLQGLPEDFALPGWSLSAKYRAVGNGVPVPMARAIALAVRARAATHGLRACICGCARVVQGKGRHATAGCRKTMERRRRDHSRQDNDRGDTAAATPEMAVGASIAGESGAVLTVRPGATAGVSGGNGDRASPGLASYPGSKAAGGVAEKIIRQMPPHGVYIEPFAGMAAVFRLKRPAAASILCDLSENVIRRLSALPGVTRPGTRIVCADALQLLTTEPAVRDPGTLIYLDPPYLRETRTRLLYECEYETAEQHTTLLSLVKALPCMVMISGYDSPLYRSMLQTWRVVMIPAMTRGGMRTECLWCNFPEPTTLHDARFAGKDYRERERIKRRKRRWSTRFAAMDPRERQAVALALIEADLAAVEAAMAAGPARNDGPGREG